MDAVAPLLTAAEEEIAYLEGLEADVAALADCTGVEDLTALREIQVQQMHGTHRLRLWACSTQQLTFWLVLVLVRHMFGTFNRYYEHAYRVTVWFKAPCECI